jgi:prepilin peptidase CpaA
MNGMTFSTFCAVIVGCIACVTDIQTRRIPNWLTFGAAATAVMFHAVMAPRAGLMLSVSGWFVGALMMFAPFALRGLGGGDVKLVAALGAWLGPASVFWLALYAGVAGFVMAVIVAASHGYLRTAIRNVWFLLQHWTVNGLQPVEDISLDGSSGPRLAYAVPIFAGLLLAIWLR